MTYDMIILGGGPAGMSAALYAYRQNLRFILISTNLGGLANYVPSLKAYLGYQYITGFELIEKFREHLSQCKVAIKNETVTKLIKERSWFVVKTGRKEHKTKTIIIATGRRFKELNIPGESKFMHKGVHDCTICDGPVYKNKITAIIGGGRTGLYATLFMLKVAKKIYLIEKDTHLKTDGGLAQISSIIKKNSKVTILPNTVPLEIKGEKAANSIMLSTKGKIHSLSVDGVFVEVGHEPNTEFAKGLVRMNVKKEIIVNEECKTNVPGIFAAGDVTSLQEKQVVVSVGEGAKAALSTVLYLEEL